MSIFSLRTTSIQTSQRQRQRFGSRPAGCPPVGRAGWPRWLAALLDRPASRVRPCIGRRGRRRGNPRAPAVFSRRAAGYRAGGLLHHRAVKKRQMAGVQGKSFEPKREMPAERCGAKPQSACADTCNTCAAHCHAAGLGHATSLAHAADLAGLPASGPGFVPVFAMSDGRILPPEPSRPPHSVKERRPLGSHHRRPTGGWEGTPAVMLVERGNPPEVPATAHFFRPLANCRPGVIARLATAGFTLHLPRRGF